MANARYRAGYDLERATRILLATNGYLAIRSSGSKGLADIVAIKRGEVLLVQCKASGKLGPGERQSLFAAAEQAGATALAVRWAKNGHQARYPEFIHLTSPFTSGFRPWTPDYALETVPAGCQNPFACANGPKEHPASSSCGLDRS